MNSSRGVPEGSSMIIKISRKGMKVQTLDGNTFDISREFLMKAFMSPNKTLCLGKEANVHAISDPCRVEFHLWAPEIENILRKKNFPPVHGLASVPPDVCIVMFKVNGMWKSCDSL